MLLGGSLSATAVFLQEPEHSEDTELGSLALLPTCCVTSDS